MSVIVNGIDIPESTIKAEIQYHPAPSFEEARHAAARALVIRELLVQAAAELGIKDVEPIVDAKTGRRETEDEALVRAVIEQEVRIPEPDEAACRRYYESNRRRFRSEDLCEAAHILFLAASDDETATSAAKRKAEATLASILEDPATFGAFARECSACSSAAHEGQLGQIGRGQTVPEFEQALFALQDGEICRTPVKTRFGYHIIRLSRRIEGRELPFAQVQTRIAAYLREHVWRRAVSQYLQLLVGQADIRGIELDGARSPLVQ